MEGTVTIDTATGKALWADLVVLREGEEPIIFDGEPAATVVSGYVEIRVNGPSGVDDVGGESLYLVIPAKSLVGYDGGELVPDSGGNKVYTHFLGYGLLEGSLEPEE